MKLVTKPAPDPIAEIRTELADYEAQRQNAQQQRQAWHDKFMLAEGAFQACQALLAKLESPNTLKAAPPQ